MGNGKNNGIPDEFTGTVAWFRDNYGYGFIESPEFTKPIFAHYSRIMTDESFKTLSKGQIVVFQVVETIKGMMAVNIRESRIIKPKVTVV